MFQGFSFPISGGCRLCVAQGEGPLFSKWSADIISFDPVLLSEALKFDFIIPILQTRKMRFTEVSIFSP